jgi:hypothetical protein
MKTLIIILLFSITSFGQEELNPDRYYAESKTVFIESKITKNKAKYNKGKSRYPAHHMPLSTTDMAKIGQLRLNQGKWNGKQLI